MLLTVPGLSVTRREDSQHKQSLRKTHSYVHIYICTLSALQRSIQTLTQRPAETPRAWTDKQGHFNPLGQPLSFPLQRHTQTPLHRERLTPQK